MGTKTTPELIYKKNPLFGQPGEPEMLAPENGPGCTITTYPVVMSDKAFRHFVQKQLGAGVYGKVFKAAESSTDGAVSDVYAAWLKATQYDKTEVTALCDVLVKAAILADDQRKLLVGDSWPEA